MPRPSDGSLRPHPTPEASPCLGPPPPGGRGSVLSSAPSGNPRAPHRDLALPTGTRRVVHLDVDAFLASVEQACHPELAGRALVIGGLPSERNLVMSCSYEARACGVHPGMRLADAQRRCPHAIFRRGDSQAANRLRERTAFVLMGFSPLVEVASIDDFFVDLTGTARLCGSAFDAAVAMRARILERTRLPVTVGIGTSKTLARLAGKLGKPGGVAEILPGAEEAFLAGLPVEHLPGVGHSTRALLERFAIRTAGDLRAASREVLFATFGRLGLVLFERARGRDPDPVEPSYVEGEDGVLRPRAPTAIRRDSTFEPEEGRRELIEAMLAYLVERAAQRLRSHGATARSLEVRVRYVDTRPAPERIPVRVRAADGEGGSAGGSFGRREALPAPSDSTDELARHARRIFRSLPRRRALVKRIGITLTGLTAQGGWQHRMFDAALEPGHEDEHTASRADRHRDLDRVLDELRARHGFGRVLRGASLPLKATTELGPDGFRLRTPSLNQ